MTGPQDERVRLGVPVPEGLKRAMKACAALAGLTLEAWVTDVLEQAVRVGMKRPHASPHFDAKGLCRCGCEACAPNGTTDTCTCPDCPCGGTGEGHSE